PPRLRHRTRRNGAPVSGRSVRPGVQDPRRDNRPHPDSSGGGVRTPVHLIRQECRIVRRTQTGAPDPYGAPTWETTTEDTVCALFPNRGATSTEEFEQRVAAASTHRAFFLPATSLSFVDQLVMADGRTFEIVGEPRMWQHPHTLEDVYQDVDLKTWTGDDESRSEEHT